MQTRLLEGREFSSHDNQDAPRVAIINLAFSKKFLPGKDPVGQKLRIHDQWFEVVGVVANVKLQSLRASSNAEMYVPILQADPPPWTFLVVRSAMEVSTLVPTVRKAVSEVAPDEPVYDVRTMADRLNFSLAPQRFSSLLLGIFAGLALLLAAIGIYGVIAYSVAQRTHEIGIRMALGAGRDDVLRMVLKQGAKIALFGLAVGVFGALLATALLSSLLYGVAARDPVIFLCVAGMLFVVVLLATYGPARKASKVDPPEALRCE
jgi:putative ABC transport system permease protein